MSHRFPLLILVLFFCLQSNQAQQLVRLPQASQSTQRTWLQNDGGGLPFGPYPFLAFQQTSNELVYASFFATDSATSLVNADTGQSWTQLVGTWGTLKYRAYLSSPGGDGNCAAIVETGVSNANLSVQLNGVNNLYYVGITFRATDASNFFFVRALTDRIQLWKKQGGGYSFLQAYSGGVSEGDFLSIEMQGDSIVVKQNGVTRITRQDSFNQGATKHGIFADSANVSLKHFVVATGPTTSDWIRITNPKPYQIYQRDASGHANINISGTYAGNPAAIEARWNNGAWQTLTSNPSGGSFTGTLSDLNAGQGILEVRFTDNPAAFWRQRYVGIGDIYLVAGQSNAEGRINTPQFYTHQTLRAGVYDQQNRWREAYDPTDGTFTNGQNSVWPLLATKIMASQNVPVAFITTAEGATGLTTVGYFGGIWQRTNYTYESCVTIVHNSGVNGLKAILWYQGETDANSPSTTVAQYRTGLQTLRSNLSTDFNLGSLPLVTAQLAYFHTNGISTETRESLDAVRLAQANAQDANIFLGSVLYDLDISEASSSSNDGQHIHTPAHAQIEATRWWRSLSSIFYGGPQGQGRGPQLQSLTKVDPTHIDVAWTVSAGPLMPANPPTIGWRVTDGVGLVSVASAVRQTDNTVRLTLSRALNGAVKVSWASYNDAVGVSLTDNTADALPAEPFINKSIAPILFLSDRDGNYEIYVMDADGSNQTRLTNNPAMDYAPVWSPDRTKIAFRSNRNGHIQIFIMNADGSNQHTLTDYYLDYAGSSISWSPDGTRITFDIGLIYVVNTDGTNLTQLTNEYGPDLNPTWSPDGTKIAFESYRGSNGLYNSEDIFVVNVDGSNLTQLTHQLWQTYPGATFCTTARWSPDNSKISFVTTRSMNYVPLKAFVMNADGTNVRYLSSEIPAARQPSWSPDGTKIAFYGRAGTANAICLINSDGTGFTSLTGSTPGVNGWPGWSPDGSQVGFLSTRDGNLEINAISIGGGSPVNLTNNPASDDNFDW
jgi:Tol biopolymer transport system component